ncbi:hypothetical protein THAOC_04962, partial [Thalassiosira oceanica]
DPWVANILTLDESKTDSSLPPKTTTCDEGLPGVNHWSDECVALARTAHKRWNTMGLWQPRDNIWGQGLELLRVHRPNELPKNCRPPWWECLESMWSSGGGRGALERAKNVSEVTPSYANRKVRASGA